MNSSRIRQRLTFANVVAAIALAAPAGAAAAPSGPHFVQTPGSTPLGDGPVTTVSADFNGDGRNDVATANRRSDDVSVLLATSKGFAKDARFAVGHQPSDLEVTDLNVDGHPDLAVANSGSDDVSVLLGTGDGSFAMATELPTGDLPISIAVRDIDGDGPPDLLVANKRSKDVTLSFGNGSGGASETKTLKTTTAPQCTGSACLDTVSVAALDLTGDGRTDIAISEQDYISVFRNNGGRSFVQTGFTEFFEEAILLLASDVTGDGNDELLVADDEAALSVLGGDGQGGVEELATGGGVGNFEFSPTSLSTADVDLDGDTDVAITNTRRSVGVILNSGDGDFGRAQDYGAGFGPSATLADFTGDGRPDISVARRYSDSLTVFENFEEPPKPERVKLHLTGFSAGKGKFAGRISSAESRCLTAKVTLFKALKGRDDVLDSDDGNRKGHFAIRFVGVPHGAYYVETIERNVSTVVCEAAKSQKLQFP